MNFLILDSYFSYGRFTNKASIGPATQFPIVNDLEQIAFWIKGTSTFGNDILNLPGATIIATHDGGANVLERYVIALRRDASVPIINEGLISASATRDSLHSHATGVLLNGGGEFANSGTVRALAQGYYASTAVGLESNVSTWQINYGSISAEARGGSFQNFATAGALNAGGTLVNNGTITSTTSSGVALQSTGVSVTGRGLLQNNGSILATGNESTSARAVMAKDSSVINSGNISARVSGGPELTLPYYNGFDFSVAKTDVSTFGIAASSLQNSGEVSARGSANAGTGGPGAGISSDYGGNVEASVTSLGANAESAANKGLIWSEALSNAFSVRGFPSGNRNATAVSEATALEGFRIENAALKAIFANAVADALSWFHARATADSTGIASEKSFLLKDSFVSLINAGIVIAASRAHAEQYGGHPSFGTYDGSATATSTAVGITQDADSTILSTSGDIIVSSEASASTTFTNNDHAISAQADATAIKQLISYSYSTDTQPTTAVSNNTGRLTVSAKATTAVGTLSNATASAGGIVQEQGPNGELVIPGDLQAINYGRMSVSATASTSINPYTTGEAGPAQVSAVGISQRLYGINNVATATNKGAIIVGSTGVDGSIVGVSSIGIDQGSKAFSPPGTTHLTKASNDGQIVVSSKGVGGTTDVTAIGIRQNPLTDGAVANTGTVSVQAESHADAEATASVAAVQQALQFGGSMPATVEIAGSMTATGFASGVGHARVDSFGVSQRGARNPATGNAGTIVSESVAWAVGAISPELSSAGDALVEAFSTGIFQTYSSFRARLQFIGNNGTVRSSAASRALSAFSAAAKSVASAIGAHQVSRGTTDSTGDVTLINAGNLSGEANASSPGTPFSEDRVRGDASASATGALQSADSQNANKVYLENANAGTIAATASGSTGVSAGGTLTIAGGRVAANATGVAQRAGSLAETTAELANRGNISAASDAVSSATVFQADATAVAFGVEQSAISPTRANAFLTNDGAISARANAETRSPEAGYATARATGVKQSLNGGGQFQSLNNIGSISAAVTATATGPDSIALGESRGVDVQARGLLPLAIVNYVRARIAARADTTAGSVANAFAEGIYVASGAVDGTITNLGTIEAFAKATSTDAADGGISRAIGIHDPSGTNNLTITNYGTIAAYAEANTEAGATAIKIMTDDEGAGQEEADTFLLASAQMPAALALGPVTTIINDNGVLYAGYSLDGGVTVHRGLAIDTTLAPNPVAVLLSGGYILGDIELSADDTITMTEPTVILGNLNAPASELAIADGQKLTWLVGTEATDSANFFGLPVFTDSAPMTMTLGSFTVETGSTLSLRGLTPDLASMPSIDATTASLHGTLALGFGPGLFQDVTVFENLITAGTLDGAFSDIIDNSVLLDPSAANDGSGIDLSVTRLPFDGVAGLTGNQHAIAKSIEDVYPALGGGSNFEQAVGHLFTLNSADYAAFLDQLTGAEYAQHLQAVLSSMRPVQNLITDRMECAGGTSIYVAPEGAAVDDGNNEEAGCFAPEHGSVWLRAYGAGTSLDGDERAPGFSETQFGLLLGADYSFDGNWFAGAAAGYRSSDMNFDDWGGRAGASIDYDGLQLAAYGGYDDGAAYARAILGYGNYEGESHRLIQFDTSPVDPSGELSSSAWSAYAEAGRRLAVSDDFLVTPFVGLSYARAHLDGFTESDPEGTGVALEVDGANATSLATRLGVRLETDIDVADGTVTPVLALGWEHEFKDTYQKLDMSFADAPSGTEFEVSGSKSPRDSLSIDAGVRFAGNNNFEGGVFYTGFVNEDYASHAATLRFGFKF